MADLKPKPAAERCHTWEIYIWLTLCSSKYSGMCWFTVHVTSTQRAGRLVISVSRSDQLVSGVGCGGPCESGQEECASSSQFPSFIISSAGTWETCNILWEPAGLFPVWFNCFDLFYHSKMFISSKLCLWPSFCQNKTISFWWVCHYRPHVWPKQNFGILPTILFSVLISRLVDFISQISL